jgi:3-oxoadipate enol-lactonase
MELKGGVIGATGIAYRVDGPDDAPALVFVNSLGTHHGLWDAQVDAFVGDHRVVRFDFCGHGASDPPRGPVSIASFGDDLIALLDHLGLERADVCGCSLGGMVALWLAAERPTRIARAVLANTGARIGTIERWNARIEAVRRDGMEGVVDSVLARFFSIAFREREPGAVARVGAMLRATDPRGYIAACAALRDADLRGALPAIRVPTLVVAGSLDEATPPSLAEQLHVGIAGSRLAIIPGAAHLTNVERPDAFNAVVREFLSGVDGPH